MLFVIIKILLSLLIALSFIFPLRRWVTIALFLVLLDIELYLRGNRKFALILSGFVLAFFLLILIGWLARGMGGNILFNEL